MSAVMFVVDDRDRLRRWSPAFADLLGRATPTLGMSLVELLGERFAALLALAVPRARTAGSSVSLLNGFGAAQERYDVRLARLPDGEVELALRRIDHTRGSDLHQRFGAAVMTDVTEMIAVVDRELRLVAWNAVFATAGEAILGRPLATGDDAIALVAPASRPHWRAHYDRALAGTPTLDDIEIEVTPDNHLVYEVSINPTYAPDGAIDGALMISRNVTHFRNDAKLRHAMLGAMPDAVVVMTRDGRILDFKPSAQVPLVTPVAEIIGRHLRDLPYLPNAQFIPVFEAAFATRQTQRVEYEVKLPDGPRQRLALLTAISDRECVCVLRDVTEERAAMQRLAFTDRMVSLGTLAAGVGHELNNPLQYIYGNIELALDMLRARGDDEICEFLDESLEGVRRAKSIVASLKVFSRRDAAKQVVEATRLVEDALRLSASKLDRAAIVERDLAVAARVEVAEASVTQAIVAILLNAVDAVEQRLHASGVIRVSTRLLGAGQLAIEITDNGPGIPAHVRERMFDPFFTTKAVGKGTGLGLAIALQSVRGAGGDVEVDSEPGRGTTMRIRLPIVQGAPAAAATAVAPVVPTTTIVGRVLVVDDEPNVQRLMRRLLPDHTVVTVGNAAAALEALEREAFDVVLCDVQMPGRSGLELVADLRARWPDRAQAVVLMTGGLLDERQRDALPTNVEVLGKPFTRDALRTALARARGADQ